MPFLQIVKFSFFLAKLNVAVYSYTCLQDHLVQALTDYPETCAVLVKRYGIYVWGDTWQKAKTM